MIKHAIKIHELAERARAKAVKLLHAVFWTAVAVLVAYLVAVILFGVDGLFMGIAHGMGILQ